MERCAPLDFSLEIVLLDKKNMKVTGLKIKCTVMDATNTLLELFLLDSGVKDKCMAKERWYTLMVLLTMESGDRTSCMVKVPILTVIKQLGKEYL